MSKVQFLMDRNVNRVIEEALELSPEDRLRVAERLYESVPDEEIAREWLEEVERREAEWERGNIESYDAQDIIREARARLKR